jgi:CubicO group peptidase (beta-lactamase class C family)
MTRSETRPGHARSALLPATMALLVSFGGLAAASWNHLPGPWWGAIVLLGVLGLATRSAVLLWRTRSFRPGWLVACLSCLGLTLLGGGLGAGLLVALRSVAAVPFDPATIHGSVAPGFEPVAVAFRENFERRGERGAACAVYVRGRKVVDLWGGYRDPDARAPWSEDTMVNVFSATKGLAAMTLALAHSRGWLDYDERVSSYWPEFAANGKEGITVRQLLAHQAGLAALDEKVDLALVRDPSRLAPVLARQRPLWEPGTRSGYHAITIGFYEAEILRRVDPQGRTLGRFFSDEIARPLGLEFYIGLPASVPRERLATIAFYHPSALLIDPLSMPWGFFRGMTDPGALGGRAFSSPSLADVFPDYTRPELRGLELPAVLGIGEARAMARAYGCFASGGAELGLGPGTLAELAAPARVPRDGSVDLVLRAPVAFSLGFDKPVGPFRFGSGDSAFGTPGAGGGFAFADPERGVGYAYTPDGLGYFIYDDPRDLALRRALERCLGRTRTSAT